MATFKARAPPTFSPVQNDFNAFNEWRKEFANYVLVTEYFAAAVTVPVQQARLLFNLAGPEFAKFVRQHVVVNNTTSLTAILDAIAVCLKPKRFDIQNRGKLLAHKQNQTTAAKFLDDIRELYDLSNYGTEITKEQLVRDIFIAGITSNEARCLIYQQDSEKLTTAPEALDYKTRYGRTIHKPDRYQ